MDDFLNFIQDKKNPKTLAFLKEQNALADAWMQKTSDLQQKLYEEILSRIEEADENVPYKKKNYFYYSKTIKGQNYGVYCRKFKNLSAPEEIILDVNVLAKDKAYFDIGDLALSPDEQHLALSIDEQGDEEHCIQILDLKTQTFLKDKIEKTDGTIVWSTDQKHIFYCVLDETQRPFQVYRHTLGSLQTQDVLVYEENDKRYHVSLSQTKDEAFILFESESKTTSEVWFLESSAPMSSPKLIEKRTPDHLYAVEHLNGKFYIVTNKDGALNSKIMQTPVSSPQAAHWTHFLPYDSERRINALEVFQHHVVVFERFKGLTNLRVVNLKTQSVRDVPFEEKAYVLEDSNNEELDTPTLRFTYESPLTPEITYDMNLDTFEKIKLKQDTLPTPIDFSKYALDYFFVKSHDGQDIPVTFLKPKNLKNDGTNALYLKGYGAYEICREPYFDRSVFSLLDRGFAVAVAHIRGGGEKGRAWYEDGKFQKKKNSFHDFISVADYFIQNKITSEKKIGIMGGSAGGLLMGAVVNLRPELWGCVLALVPFVDTLSTMMDETLPLTVTEYEEWGDPHHKEVYDYIKSYSPIDNLKQVAYPPILATGGLNDPRVSYWEPAKWVKKINELNTANTPILLKTELESGHGGPSGRYNQIKEQAFYLAFLITCLRESKN